MYLFMANHDLSHAETAASAESRLSIRFFLQTLLAVGLLILVPIWSLYIAPNILKLSEDFSFTADVISIDDFYDEGRGQYSGGVYSATEYSYETVGFEDGVQMIVNRFSVATPEGTSIFAVERTYGIDPVTRMHRPTYGDRTRDGHLFAPRGLRRGESFTYWHINYNGPATMQFISSEQLHGLEVFVYETTYEGVTIDQTEELSHLPEVGETRGVVLEPHLTLWIEPVTGRLVKYTDDTTAYFYNLETGERSHPWNHFTNTFTEQSVKQHINEAGWEKTKVQAILYYVPALVCIFALAFLGHVFGIWRWFSQRVSLNHITVVSGVIIISTATLSLVGWFAHIESLTRVVPYASAMNPLTGVCFVILGIGIILSLYAPRVATLTGALLVIVGTTRLVGIYVPSFTQSDLLILGETVLASDVPARMAVYTALVFVLLGSVLVMVRSTLLRRLRIPEVLSWIGIMLSLFALTGFFFGSIDLIALPLFFSAAVHTAALFLLASVVMYMLFREKHVLQFIGWLTVSSVLFLTLLLSILITGLIENNIRNEAQTNFLLEADRATTQIVDRLGIYINALEGGRGLFASSDEVERDEWHAYISNLGIQENYPGIQGIGYSVFVTPDERDAHVERIREEGFPEYTIRPEGERSLYSAIVYLEPFDERNRQAFGFDMYQETVRRTGMEQARDTGQPRLSGKITLVQEIDEDVQPGFLIYVPYYGHDFIGTTLEERRQSIIGYVYSAFRARNFFEGVLGASGISDVGLAVYDGTSQSPDSELYNDIEGKVADTAYARFTDTKTVQVAGRSWTFHFVSTEKYGQTFFSQLIPLIIILVGIAVSVLITVISYVLISSRQRAVLYANEVTRDLRISKAKDEAILAGLGEGLVAIDPQGIITLVNPAFESLLGWTKEEVVGKKLADIVPMV